MYKRIAAIENVEEYNDMQEELTDRFGDMPQSADNLLRVALLKADAHKAYISRILQKEDGVRFYLYEGKLPDTEKLKKMLDEYQGKIKYAGSKEPYLLYMMQKDKKKAVSRNMYRMPSKNMIKKEKKLTADEIFNIVESVIKSIGGLYDKK